MNIEEIKAKVQSSVDTAWDNDPDALAALMCATAPCNEALADHPYMECTGRWYKDGEGRDQVAFLAIRPLGFVNGILAPLGLILAQQFDEDTGLPVGFIVGTAEELGITYIQSED